MAHLNRIVVVDIYSDGLDNEKSISSQSEDDLQFNNNSSRNDMNSVESNNITNSPPLLRSHGETCFQVKSSEIKKLSSCRETSSSIISDGNDIFLNSVSSKCSNGLCNGCRDTDDSGIEEFVGDTFVPLPPPLTNNDALGMKSPNSERKGSSGLKRPLDPPPSPPMKVKCTNSSSKAESDLNPALTSTSQAMFNAWDTLVSVASSGGTACPVDDLMFLDPFPHMDAIPEEDTAVLESDTDDTGSSVSTVIGRFSRASTANSSFSEHCKSLSKPILDFDLEKVLSPFERLERELDAEGPDLLSIQGAYQADSSNISLLSDDVAKIETKVPARVGNGSYNEGPTIEPPELFQDYGKDKTEIISTDSDPSKVTPKDHRNVLMRLDQVIASGKQNFDFCSNASDLSSVSLYSKNSSSAKEIFRNSLSLFDDEDFFQEIEENPFMNYAIPLYREVSPPPIPPRRGKHLPVRRTRSDPGYEHSIPSRIPRPTFLTRSSTFVERSHSHNSHRLGPNIGNREASKVAPYPEGKRDKVDLLDNGALTETLFEDIPSTEEAFGDQVQRCISEPVADILLEESASSPNPDIPTIDDAPTSCNHSSDPDDPDLIQIHEDAQPFNTKIADNIAVLFPQEKDFLMGSEEGPTALNSSPYTVKHLDESLQSQSFTLPSLHGPEESSVNSIKSVFELSYIAGTFQIDSQNCVDDPTDSEISPKKEGNDPFGETGQTLNQDTESNTSLLLEDKENEKLISCSIEAENVEVVKTDKAVEEPEETTTTKPALTQIDTLYDSLFNFSSYPPEEDTATKDDDKIIDPDKVEGQHCNLVTDSSEKPEILLDATIPLSHPASASDLKSSLHDQNVSSLVTSQGENPQFESPDPSRQKSVAMEIMHFPVISENSLPPSFPRQPPDGHEFPQNYTEPTVTVYSVPSLTQLKGDSTDVIHEKSFSTCEDSGVFLEDGPYIQEHSATSLKLSDHSPVSIEKDLTERLHPQNSSDGVSEVVDESSDVMRQYTIKQTVLESDGESRSDAGITSTSTDSADELDIIPIPPDTLPPPPPPPKTSPPLYKHVAGSMGRYSTPLDANNTKDSLSQRTESNFVQQRKGTMNDNHGGTYSNNMVQKTESLLSNNSKSFKKEASKWKSEECLRLNTERKWSSLSSRHKEKPVSVKDRIAMFSWIETESPSQPSDTMKSQNSFRNESQVKHAFSTDTLNEKGGEKFNSNVSKNSFSSLNRDNKWLSMDNVSAMSQVDKQEQSQAVPSLADKSNQSKNFGQNRVNDDVARKDKEGVSSYPQTQLSRYGFGTFPSGYRRSEDAEKKNSCSGILSLGETLKSTKLKGLVIPSKPSPLPGVSKALPTIVSAESVVVPKQDAAPLGHGKQKSSASSRHGKTPSNEWSDKDVDNQKQSLLSDPPWKNTRNTLPKYSPAFKSRTLELPHAVSSLSPTPPSSLTSPLSPPPSSPSSGCSSNASSSSTAAKQQGIFQFSLSHSKPVTPLLPEKPIMSPPSLPSDIDYEGDNSEDSTIPSSPPLIMAKVPSLSSRSQGSSPSSKQDSRKSDSHCTPAVNSFVAKSSTLPPSARMCNGDATEKQNSETSANISSFSLVNGTVANAGTIAAAETKSLPVSHLTNGVSNRRSSFSSSSSSSSHHRGSNHTNGGGVSGTGVNAIQRLDSLISSGSGNETGNGKGSVSGKPDKSQEVVGRFRAQPVCVGEDDTNSIVNGNAQEDNLHAPDKSIQSPVSNGQTTTHGDNGKVLTSTPTPPCGPPKVNGYCEDSRKQRWSQFGFETAESDDDDDDSHSSLSQRTEDSRHTIEDSFSDATSDSCEKSVDPDLKPRRLSQQRTVLRNGFDSTDSVRNFRALAEKWQQRAGDSRDVRTPPPPSPVCQTGPSPKKDLSSASSTSSSSSSSTNRQAPQDANVKLPPSLMPRYPETRLSERKMSMPALNISSSSSSYTSSPSINGIVKTRSRSTLTRPSSLIEDKDTLWNGNSSPSEYLRNSRGSLDFVGSKTLTKSSAIYQSASRDSLDTLGGPRTRPSYLSNNNKSVSVSDIRKAFESQTQQVPSQPQQSNKTKMFPRRSSEDHESPLPALRNSRSHSMLLPVDHRRISSIDSTASESDLGTPVRYGSVGSLTSGVFRDQYGSMTSLASTTSLISPQELQQLIDEANHSLEEAGTPTHEIIVVVLHKEVANGSIGITLAGGADYEVKEITVHKVISGSLADRDGRIRKGDRVISINGRNMKGITHREALDILKAPRAEVVLVVSRERQDISCNGTERRRKPSLQEVVTDGFLGKENSRRKDDIRPNVAPVNTAQGPIVRVELNKDSTGLGFNIEGGKDSPMGDRPLAIKRLFKSGVADRDGQLEVGDEILSVNGQVVTSMTRTEAWNYFKKLPEGKVALMIKKATS